MSQLVPPHASNELKILALGGDALNSELKKTDSMDKLSCSSREFGDLIMLGIGGFTPLEGFMGK
ncbi:sulfate adenylyltransferase, partial [Candidatus Thioglobus sp.]|nr:sulfate adenylyltransferase [Candidatus Thioglobus sp.]